MDVWDFYYIAVGMDGYVSKMNVFGKPIEHTEDKEKAMKFPCIDDMRNLIYLGYSIIRE